MPIINISVKNKIATLDSCASIVCKNSDYMAHFTFDENWNGYNVKLAKFIYDDKTIPRVFIGNDCAIPKLPNTYSCLIEVEAGDVKTAAPVHINCIPVSDDEELEETEEYKTSVYNQILELIKNGTITSATIVKTEFVGKDADGGNVYKQTFDNGMESFFTAPKGDTVAIEFGETQGTAYEGNKGAKNARDIINILNEILTIKSNLTENNSEMAQLLLDVKALSDRLNFIANSDDATLDQMKEIVDFAKQNKNFIESLTNIVSQNTQELEKEIQILTDKIDAIPNDEAWTARKGVSPKKRWETFTRLQRNDDIYVAPLPFEAYETLIYQPNCNIVYKGERYIALVREYNGSFYIGNLALINKDALFTEEPFVIFSLEDYTGEGEDSRTTTVFTKGDFPLVVETFEEININSIFERSSVDAGSYPIDFDLKIGDKINFKIGDNLYAGTIQKYVNDPVVESIDSLGIGWYSLLESGAIIGIVQLTDGNWYAVFNNPIEEHIIVELFDDVAEPIPTNYLPMETLATKEEINSAIGDISTALDELHEYAQNLVSGVV